MKRRDFLATTAAASLAPAAIAAAAQAPLRLANTAWSVEIDAETLAITVTPAGAPPILVSRGTGGHRVGALAKAATALAWTWDEDFDLSCTLDGADLAIRVAARRPGQLRLV